MNRLVGVIIARFQIHTLTPAHQYLLNQVATRVDRVLILLGVHPVGGTKKNPLDYPIRARMVQDWWSQNWPQKDVVVVPLYDAPTDQEWAARIDQMIAGVAYNSPATIFCGPDGAGPAYQEAGGKWPIDVLDSMGGHATKLRDSIIPRYTEDFRAGMIYQSERRFVNPFPVIDVLVRRDDEVLLGQKKHDNGKWRFIGGFVDIEDYSLEDTVKREVMEEAGIEIGHPTYVGSGFVDDWRFRGGPECIMSSVFTVPYVSGAASAADDLDALAWFHRNDVANMLHSNHLKLYLELGLQNYVYLLEL